MSTAADKARARAARLAAGQGARPATAPVSDEDKPEPALAVPDVRAGEPDDLPPLPRAARVTPVRMTVDLAPALHAQFDDWANKAARDYQLGRSIRADVFRVLLRKFLADPSLQHEVITTLRRERQKRA